jgi:2-oxoglutarate ferredoxin oxidoreductase subunit gamma
MTYEILLAGFGGQGILFAGKLLAYCAMEESKEISWLPSYGPEMRGGKCNCSVCISDEPIGSPQVLEPDLLVVLNGPSFDAFMDSVKPGGKAFVDSSMVDAKSDRKDIDIFYVPATQIADDANLAKGANIVLLGKLLAETGIFSFETVRKALEKHTPAKRAHTIDNNMNALKLGAEYNA